MGNCVRDNSSFNGSKICYVSQPSSCADLKESASHPGEKISAEACLEPGSFSFELFSNALRITLSFYSIVIKLVFESFVYLVPSCTCKDLTERAISCSQRSKSHNGKKACWVKHPSSCGDLIDSTSDTREQLSAEACSTQGTLL